MTQLSKQQSLSWPTFLHSVSIWFRLRRQLFWETPSQSVLPVVSSTKPCTCADFSLIQFLDWQLAKGHFNKVLSNLWMCAHRPWRQSNQLRSNSYSREYFHAASASNTVPTWDLFQTEHVHPDRIRGFPVCPLSRRIHRRREALWRCWWGLNYNVPYCLSPLSASVGEMIKLQSPFLCVLVPV